MQSPSPRTRRIRLLGPLCVSGVAHATVLGVFVFLGIAFGRGGAERTPREYRASFVFPEVLAAPDEPLEIHPVELPPEPSAEPEVVESLVWGEAEPLDEPEVAVLPARPAGQAWFEPGELKLGELRARPVATAVEPARPAELVPSPPATLAPEPPAPEPVRSAPVAQWTPAPAYPRLARRASEEGSVLVRLALDAAGAVIAVELLESSGHRRLDEATLETLRTWRFEPAREDGVAVPTSIQHRVTYRLDA